MKQINGFEKEYRFLSNFWCSEFTYKGIKFQSVEAAFQGEKAGDLEVLKVFSKYDPSIAKKEGRKLNLRSDWDEVKVVIMSTLVYLKFSQNKELKDKLLATGDSYLEETNWWRDTTWGVCNGVGQNLLGKILMQVREKLKDE